jgi:hypothetical protein
MRNNLQVYHSVLNQICQWLSEERVTRQHNMALSITGLFLGAAGRVTNHPRMKNTNTRISNPGQSNLHGQVTS